MDEEIYYKVLTSLKENIKEVEFDDNIKMISTGAFLKCKALTEINLPDSVEIIADYAFVDSGIKKIKLPDNIKNLSISFIGLNNFDEIIYKERNIKSMMDTLKSIYNNYLEDVTYQNLNMMILINKILETNIDINNEIEVTEKTNELLDDIKKEIIDKLPETDIKRLQYSYFHNEQVINLNLFDIINYTEFVDDNLYNIFEKIKDTINELENNEKSIIYKKYEER